GGSGLGLSIARENARLHGGDIVAANTGTGARFELRLPGEAW
ncbi:ATP-binding protein, partial [Amycolatopsis mediterranei]